MLNNTSQTLIQDIGVGTIWMSIGMFMVKSSGLLYSFLIIQQLSLYEYGVAALIISLPGFLSILTLPSLETVVIADMGVEIGKGRVQAARNIFSKYWLVRITFALVAWGILFFSAPLVSHYYNETIATTIQIISFTFLISPMRSMYGVVFRVTRQFKTSSLQLVVEEVCKLIIVAIGLIVFDLSIIAIGIAYIGGEVIALGILFFRYHKVRKTLFVNTHEKISWRDCFSLLYRHGKWSIFGSYLASSSQSLRLWAVKFFVGTDAVGLFSLAYGLMQNTGSLVPLARIVQPLIPQLIDEKQKLYTLINKGIKYQLLGYLVVGTAGVFIFPYIITALFPEYVASIELYHLLMLVFIPVGLSAFCEPVFYAFKAQRNLFVATLKRTALMLILLPTLLYFFGLYGVVFEFLITRTYYSWERLTQMQQYIPKYVFKWRDIIRYDDFDRMIVGKLTSIVRRS